MIDVTVSQIKWGKTLLFISTRVKIVHAAASKDCGKEEWGRETSCITYTVQHRYNQNPAVSLQPKMTIIVVSIFKLQFVL